MSRDDEYTVACCQTAFMRVLPQDLINAHALNTVAPPDLGDFYLSAVVATIKPSVQILDFDEVFDGRNDIVLFVRNKTLQELGLDLPGLVWHNYKDNYLHICYANTIGVCYRVYCKETDVCQHNFLTFLEDDEYLVVAAYENTVYGYVKLPPRDLSH